MHDEQTIRIRGSYLALFQFIVAACIGLGSFWAYTEAKYASKESVVNEVTQRKTDVQRIEDVVNKLDKKIDRIIEILIK